MKYRVSSWNKLHNCQPPGTVPRNQAFLISLTINPSLRELSTDFSNPKQIPQIQQLQRNNSELSFLQIHILQITSFCLVCKVNFLQGNMDWKGVHIGLGQLEHYFHKSNIYKRWPLQARASTPKTYCCDRQKKKQS